jgi:hypothetical protein
MLSWLVLEVFGAPSPDSPDACRRWRAGFTLLYGQSLELAPDLFPGEHGVRPHLMDIRAAQQFRGLRKPISKANEPLRKQNAASPPRIGRRPAAEVILCQPVNLLDHLPGPFDAANQPRTLGVASLPASFADSLPGLTEGQEGEDGRRQSSNVADCREGRFRVHAPHRSTRHQDGQRS